MASVAMENGAINRLTNHERDLHINGINGRMGSPAPHGMNGDRSVKVDPPPEIPHITQGFFPLASLLRRQAQRTHNALNDKLVELSRMALPASAMNGNANLTLADDSSHENLNKKTALLHFAQEQHETWLKILVLTQWSRRSEDVSRVIDLRVYLMGQKTQYDEALWYLSEMKRGLVQARVPNPDLKTAAEVLTTGRPRWMPQLGYIEPPPLTSPELLNVLENINTLLSIRMNLYDYDKTPLPFRQYTIKSGRVTFRVPGEFELDLTIADEDPEKQFWFIDFRFLFSPAPAELPESLLFHLERKVNAVLGTDGLMGCYRFLHEFVLTHKLNELRKQAVALSAGVWIDTLKVEPLRRSLCIQYWTERPKSWVILGVDSGKKAASRIGTRWFRDGKEVDIDLKLDLTELSAEALIKSVIARHISHILSSTHALLLSRPLYASGELSLVLQTSDTEPIECKVKAQMTARETVTLSIEPITGKVTVSPASLAGMNAENQLSQSKDVAADARGLLEHLRCYSVSLEIKARAVSVGWLLSRNPGLKPEELKAIMPPDTLNITWLSRPGWVGNWYMVATISMSGERWWLLEITDPVPKIKSHLEVPIANSTPKPTYQFLSTLHLYAAALVSHFIDLRQLHVARIPYVVKPSSRRLSTTIKIPVVLFKLSKLVECSGKPWAYDMVRLTFQGLEARPSDLKAVVVSEARMVIPRPAKFALLSERVDRDVAFHRATGAFAFRLHSKIGESVVPTLKRRIRSVERLVQFVEVMQKYRRTLTCESISLRRIVLTYGGPKSSEAGDPSSPPYRARIEFGTGDKGTQVFLDRGNPHIRILGFLTKVLNATGGGLDTVASLLQPTLPALRALGAIEQAWSPVSLRGAVMVHPRSATWYRLQYRVAISPGETIMTRCQRIFIDVQLKQRGHQSWWLVKRIPSPSEDVLGVEAKLAQLWDERGAPWRGLRTSAAARPFAIEALLKKVNEVVMAIVPGGLAGDSSQNAVVLD